MKQSLRPLLLPLVPAYRLALLLRELRLGTSFEPMRRLRWPVVSIGNLSTGGAGKTPLTIALAKALEARGLRVDMLSRGYGRTSQLPARVRPDGAAVDFGDEPLLIARETGVPVYVAAQRYQAGLLAEAEHPRTGEWGGVVSGHDFSRADEVNKMGRASAPAGCLSDNSAEPEPTSASSLAPEQCIHLLDDGFQHRQLARDVDILLLNRQDFAGALLPAGNLREPLNAIRRASVLAIPADDPQLEAELRAWGWIGPIWRLHRKMKIPSIDGPVVAFCGIARPDQFFAGLEAAGLQIALRKSFPDHHRYTLADLRRLVSSARAVGAATLITTEKDKIRLEHLFSSLPESLPLKTASLRIEIENLSAAVDWLANQLAPPPPTPPL
ncbi:MAG: tetraacyldisaccharide 4'-kinase [Terracidiphilus sp.]|jgi:tetraacyldisaccharide 4'-kinase